jgi:tRNA dimethylallyltransferase
VRGDVEAEAPIAVICGPTAAGKSSLALALAERHGLTIVSADSRQVYRGFDVGTAKPTRAERARVPHAGLDVADPVERYSAARWAEDARGWIAAARDAGREPLVVGGTGFYLRALTAPLADAPPLDAGRRGALQGALAALGADELRRWCLALDAPRASLGRAQQLRALEVALLAGRRLSDLHRDAPERPGFRAHYLVVDPGPALGARIARRVREMFDAGWVAEAAALDAAVPADAPAWTASGYRTVRDVARGALDAGPASERITIETRQYAKRQRTWFRHQLPAERVTVADPTHADVDAQVERWWAARSAA